MVAFSGVLPSLRCTHNMSFKLYLYIYMCTVLKMGKLHVNNINSRRIDFYTLIHKVFILFSFRFRPIIQNNNFLYNVYTL